MRFERITTVCEILADVCTVALAVTTSCWLYELGHIGKRLHYPAENVAAAALALALLFVLLLDRAGAYSPANSLMRIRETERILRVTLTAFGLVFPVTFFEAHLISRYVVLGTMVAVPIMLVYEKQLVFQVIRNLHSRGYGIQNVLIYGAGLTGRSAFSSLMRSPKLGLRPTLIVDDNPALEGQAVHAYGYRREHSIRVQAGFITREMLRHHAISLVLVGIPSISRERLNEVAAEAFAAHCAVAFVPELGRSSDATAGYADIDGLLVASLRPSESKTGYELTKRIFDFAVSLALILTSAPVWAVIALLIRLDSKGPVFFHQTRIGRNGAPFRIFKFRSMRTDAPKYGYHPRDKGDPRVTRVGAWLRKTSLDEVPQLLNVLRGEMSLVGPRPEMPFIVERYDDHQRQRLQVTPGITGLWQLSGDRAFLIHENLQYDLYYICHRNFFMDIALLLHTFMFAMRGV
jgi:exopolysaccharide biosynthesis polyprenyl glycosylphosphotransferase